MFLVVFTRYTESFKLCAVYCVIIYVLSIYIVFTRYTKSFKFSTVEFSKFGHVTCLVNFKCVDYHLYHKQTVPLYQTINRPGLDFWPGPGWLNYGRGRLFWDLGWGRGFREKMWCTKVQHTIWYTSEQQILNTSGNETKKNLGICYFKCAQHT